MCEKEIIKCAEFLGNREDETTVKIDNDFYDERDIWKGLLDLYNKEKGKNTFGVVSKDKLRKFIKEDSFEGTYNFETISKKNLLKFLEDSMKIETKYNIGDKVWIVYEGDFYNSSTGERQNSCEVSIYTDKIMEVTFYENGLVYNFENYPDELKEDEIILYDEKDKLLQKIEELMNKINEREEK